MKKTSFPDSATQGANAKAKPINLFPVIHQIHAEKLAKLPGQLARLIHDCVEEIAVHPVPEVRTIVIIDGVLELVIDAHPGDVKRLIGTNGAHINALRRFAKLWGDANGFSVTIPDFDAPKDHGDRYDEFSPDRDPQVTHRLVTKLQAMTEAVAKQTVHPQVIDSASQTYVVFRYNPGAVDERLLTALAGPLAILGNAMGKKNGRNLAVHIRSQGLVRNATSR
jgi:predicted RNA-binding protein YlqC (UPF0109 family)